MAWTIRYYQTARGESPVEIFLNGQSEKAHTKCLAYIAALMQHPNDLPPSYAKKVEGDIWELRPEFGNIEYRFFYTLEPGELIFIAHAIIKKGMKLKRGDIDLARTRIAEMRQLEQARKQKEQKG